jgi:hypothetical protein
MPTITSRVHRIVMKALEDNPEGVQWSELLQIIKEQGPDIHPKTANGLVWKLLESHPKEIHKPEKGRFQLLKYKRNK